MPPFRNQSKYWQLPWWILAKVNFDDKSCAGTTFSSSISNLVQIRSKQLSYGHLTDFKMAAAAILDFWPMRILMVNLAAGPHLQPTYQIRCKYHCRLRGSVSTVVTMTSKSMGALKMLDVKMTDVKLTDQCAGHEIAGHENDGPNDRT